MATGSTRVGSGHQNNKNPAPPLMVMNSAKTALMGISLKHIPLLIQLKTPRETRMKLEYVFDSKAIAAASSRGKTIEMIDVLLQRHSSIL